MWSKLVDDTRLSLAHNTIDEIVLYAKRGIKGQKEGTSERVAQ